MGDAVTVLVAILVALVVTGAVVVLSTRRWLRRRVEISRRHRSHAPLRWLVWPGMCAALHRRLRDAVLVLRSVVPAPRRRRSPADRSPFEQMADEIELHAVALSVDLQLVARLHGPSKAAARQQLAGQVRQLEAVAHRVARSATAAQPARPGATPTPEALAEVSRELDALEEARDELARLEAAVGLHGFDRREHTGALPGR